MRSPSRILATFALVTIFNLTTAAAQDRGLTVQARAITGNPAFNIGKQYAVIIGIDRYKEWTALRNAVSEAKSVKEILLSRYYIDEFIELYDSAATASAIRKLFAEDLPKKLNKEDSLFIFYAGHGYLDTSNTGFWIASDGVKDVYDQRGWIPNQQIRNYLSSFKAQRVLVVADACFSGDFLNVSRGSGPTIDSSYFARALQLQARQVLTSGASETVPDESEFGRYFTMALERNSDPVLDPFSMYDRIRTNVTQTVPLLGTIPGNEAGASFAFFLRPSYGAASITVASGATIEIDGKEKGAAVPGKTVIIPELTAGIHELRIVYQGAEERRSMLVRAGETTAESFTWKAPRAGKLAVSSQADARVLVDGKPAGSVMAGKTLELDDITEGERIVTLQYADNQEDRRVLVYPDSVNAVSFSYRIESFATVSFEGFPDGAVVFSAGRELGSVYAGRFVAKNLVPGPRSFSIYYDRWSEPYPVSVDAGAQGTTLTSFQGGRIFAVSVPRNVQVAVNGKVIARSDGLRDSYDLGLFPAGPHAITFSGDNWETQRSDTIVRAGTDTRVAASMTMRPGSPGNPAGTQLMASSTAPSSGGAYGFGAIRIRNDSGLPEGLEVRLRREGSDEPLPFQWDQVNVLTAGRYVVEARKAGDPEWPFSSSLDIVSGGEKSVTVPPMEYSTNWKIADLELRRQVASLVLGKAIKAKDGRTSVANVGAFLGFASLAVLGYGVIDGFIARPEYDAATDPAVITGLHNRINLDMNLWAFGSLAGGLSIIPQSFRLFGRKEIPAAQEALWAIDMELRNLRNPK